MRFRWVIGIALWTCLSGPAFHSPRTPARPVSGPAAAASSQPRQDKASPAAGRAAKPEALK